MAQAFFFICMFLITVSGLLLFRPTQIQSITDYSQPAAIEERKNITVKMAEFLEKNPKIVMQEHHSEEVTTIPPSITSHTPTAYRVEILFQGSNLRFGSLAEYDQWIYKNTSQEPLNFLNQLHENGNPELYLDTLKKVSEINKSDEVTEHIKGAYLELAKNLIRTSDHFHQQMAQQAVQSYLDLEKNKDLGKKIADEILEANNKPRN